jgi:hypothetical protein
MTKNGGSIIDMLETLYTNHGFHENLNLIHNLDETGFNPEHLSPKILTNEGNTLQAQAITSQHLTLVTTIGEINVSRMANPPFLIFKRKFFNNG